MSGFTIRFFHSGVADAEIAKWQASQYPYSVRANTREKHPTFQEAEAHLAWLEKAPLAERVQPVAGKPHLVCVDKFFIVRSDAKAPKDEALKLWENLRKRCQQASIGAGAAGIGMCLGALAGAPVYVEVLLLVAMIGACCFVGWGFARYQAAERELATWRSPGEDFAMRRQAAWKLPLDQLTEMECHYHLEQPSGTLLGMEIFSLFRKSFQPFAEPLLARNCDKPEEQAQWVGDFLKSNPLTLDFFKKNPHLPKEKEWQVVSLFQMHLGQLFQQLKSLHDVYLPQFKKRTEDIDKLRSEMRALAKEKSLDLKLDAEKTARFQNLLMQALEEEHLSKISAFYTNLAIKIHHIHSFIYPQVREFLEQAHKGLIELKSYRLQPVNLRSLVPKFQEELDKISKDYPKNVIAKAKALSTDPLYQEFIDKVFNP